MRTLVLSGAGLCCAVLCCSRLVAASDLDPARDRQDRAELVRLAQSATDPYRAALAYSYASEVALELGDKKSAQADAEAGIKQAEQFVAKNPNSSEAHRILGTLCGQVIPAAVLTVLKYGHCAQDEVNKAMQLDGKAAMNWVSQGVGHFYLPQAFGGGVDLALKDFQKAVEIDPKIADAHLWLGRTYLKLNREADARKSFEQAVALAPNRVWAKQQLAKLH